MSTTTLTARQQQILEIIDQQTFHTGGHPVMPTQRAAHSFVPQLANRFRRSCGIRT